MRTVGACHIAAGLVGHGTLVRLDLNENNIGELGCAGLAKALLGNGVLAHLSLAANRVDSHGAGHLARAVRLSGALLSLELGNNPLIGAVGAKHLGEALAGGSADLLSRLEAEAPLARTERFRVTLQSLGEDGVGSDDDDGTAPQAKGPRRGRGKSARGGALEHLGLAECDVMRGRNVAGVCALASGLERGGALTSLDLSRCDMSDFGASELAQALRGALGRSRLVVLRLQGNSSLSPRWADRDSYVKLTHQGTIADDPIFNPDDDTTQSSTRTTTTQSSKSRGTADRHNLVPTIATSLELNRRDVARDAKERGEPVRGSRASLSLDEGSVSSLDNDSASAVSMVSMASVRRGSAPPEKKRSKLLTVPPAPAADKATGRLEGEWTNGWLAQEDRVEAKAARAEAVARADEASRQRLEEDAVDAACAAAGAATWLALLQPPDGPKLLAAVVAELREAGALAKKVAAAAPKRKVDTRAVAHATLAVVDDVESVSTLATDQLETKVAAQTPRSFAALLAEAVVPRGKVTLAVDAKTDSGPAPAEAVVAGRRAPRRGAVVDPAAAHLRAVFMRVDVDDSGGIDASELPALLSRLGWKHMSKKALQEMMGKIDGNSSGAIDFQELCSWYFTGGRKEIRNAKRRPAFFQGGEGDAVELNADALKQLVAEARAAAQVSARAAYRSRFPTRGNCVCAVCGVAALDVGAAAKHYDAATATREISAHVIWRKKAAANFRRAQMLDRARASVARQARGKEGRSTSTAAGNVAANADEVSSQFPVLLVYHPEVQHFIDLQTYDIPDSLLGRPTGALTLHASAVFCVGDGHGNAECAGAGAEWLRILMPPHVERAWAPDAARSALMAAEAVAAARHGASLRELFVDGGEERAPLRRAVVWLRNRSLEYAHGKKSVLVPLRPGPTPLDRSEADLRKDIELGICDVGGKKLKVKPPSKPPSKLATLLRAATFQTGAARRDVEKRAEAAHLKRLKILGEHAEYVVDTRSLRSGPQIVLWARPRWYRVAPALHRRTRLKVRAVPEAYAHVLGDVGWGDAILAYGRGGDWLIGAFGDRDNAWFLEKSPRRALLHLVGSTVQLKTLRARGVSPQTIELGATAKGTIVSQAPARLQAKGNALRAEDEDVDDADLERLGAPDDKGDADG